MRVGGAPRDPPVARAPALAVLGRFSLAAWRASPAGALADAALTLIAGIVPVAELWAARGLVNAIAATVAHSGTGAVAGSLHLLSPLLPWAVALVVLGVVGKGAFTLQWALTGYMKPVISLQLEQRLLEAGAAIELAGFEQPRAYDRMQRARDALGYRMTNLLTIAARIGQVLVTLAGYAALLWVANPALALVVVLPTVPSVWLKVRAARSGYTHDYDATPLRRMMAYLQGLLLGAGSGQEVRVFGLFAHIRDRWRRTHGEWRLESLAKAWVEVRAVVGSTAAEAAAYAAAIAILADLIAHRRLDLGDYVVLTGAAGAFQVNLARLLSQVRDMLQDLPLLRDLHTFMELATEARARAGTAAFPRPLRQGIDVNGLTFRYPGADEEALRDVTFTAAPGEPLAIVGANGSGKSTLIKLLRGLYRPDRGSIAYDGVDVRDIAPAEIAANCATVFQDFARFRRPLREEVAPGAVALQADDATLWAALEAAGFGERAESLPAGLYTCLDPFLVEPGKGADLSGGEWQKVAKRR